MARYDDRTIAINSNDMYKDLFDKRNIKYVRQYMTPSLRYPLPEEIQQLDLVGRVWSVGDRLYKLAFEYYGDVELWYIIAHYNQKMEPQIKIGEIIYIPLPLERIKKFLGL